MAILSTVKKVIPYIKEAAGYVLCHISSQAVEMDDGTLLQDKIESMDSEIDGKANTSHTHDNSDIIGLTPDKAVISSGSGKLTTFNNVTSTEVGYLEGVTSNIQDQIDTLNSNLKKHYTQGGLIATSNVNNYFRSAHVTFETPYKTGTKPNVVATVRNYGNTVIDARLTTLYKNESATSVDLFVADPQGETGGLGYEISWMAVGEID